MSLSNISIIRLGLVKTVVAAVLTVVCNFVWATNEEGKVHNIRVPARVFDDNTIHSYFVDVLTLALNKTQRNGLPFRIVPDPFNANQDRLLRQVKEGSTDVTWAVTSIEREEANQAVFFPLARGLLGYRVFLIHPDNENEYREKPLSELKESLSVQGIGWPDTDIMRFNGYRVKEVPMSMMFKLIESKMADYFPRSVMEIEFELSSRQSEPLMIEPARGFYYPSPMYFFVNKRNRMLAERIHKGLDIALNDGSLVALFNKQPFSQSAFKILKGRDILKLQNPLLSPQSQRTLENYKDFIVTQ
ncbi:MAG: hypothetical protein CBB67_017325 [Alteromonadaceae bacterium TMED7]|nr:hypothetical protein [Alteromonadaceae bacterium]RPH15555.1 MAG: hypothetical protein CBB67_017325 [Alteromonadaceae bacterium TMED7]